MFLMTLELIISKNHLHFGDKARNTFLDCVADDPFSYGDMVVAKRAALESLVRRMLISFLGSRRWLTWPTVNVHFLDVPLFEQEKKDLSKILHQAGFRKINIVT